MYIDDPRDRYIFARWCYLMGESYMTDVEYDTLDKWYKELYPDDEYATRSWSLDPCPIELLTSLGRTDLIKSLIMGYQAESVDSINSWSDLKEYFSDLNEPTRVSFKIDGWNARASYFNGKLVDFSTRGRSGANKNAGSIQDLVPDTIPIMGRVAITGEANIPNDKWEGYKYYTGNTNQRSSVSTAIAKGDKEFLSFLAFNIFVEKGYQTEDTYKTLKELGFTTPYSKTVYNYEQLVAVIKMFSILSKTYNHLTDGLVVENSSIQIAVRLGAWEEKVNSSYVIGYEEKQGMYGVAINVKIKPVLIGERKCSNIPMTNIANIIENDLQIGSPIAFNIRSGATSAFDMTATHKLQREWYGRYDAYQSMIDSSCGV